MLAGWLHRAAQNLATKAVRSDARRRVREQEAATMNELLAESEPVWEQISPHLDAALGELSEADRDAVLMRYFERKSAHQMGQTLGISDEAAQKRVNRAVERLRQCLLRQGITAGAGGLVAAISSNAVGAIPVGLTETISTATALAAKALQSSTIVATAETIAMTTMQKTLIGATLVVAVATGVYETVEGSRLRNDLERVQVQHSSMRDEIAKLTGERDKATSELLALRADNERLNSNATEIARLRGETARLRENARELAQLKSAATVQDAALEGTVKSWAARAALLRQRLDERPEHKIPELSLLGEKEWLDAVKNLDRLESDADFRQASANLRSTAKQGFGELTRKALKKFAEANGGMLPTDLEQLKPYYDKPVEEGLLQRYSILQAGKLSEAHTTDFLFAETAPAIDVDYDSVYQYRMNGTRSSGVAGKIIEEAAVQYAAANQGLLPTEAAQLTPFLKQPVDLGKVRKMMAEIPPSITTLEQLRAAGFLK